MLNAGGSNEKKRKRQTESTRNGKENDLRSLPLLACLPVPSVVQKIEGS